jgi:hypothetical protein
MERMYSFESVVRKEHPKTTIFNVVRELLNIFLSELSLPPQRKVEFGIKLLLGTQS